MIRGVQAAEGKERIGQTDVRKRAGSAAEVVRPQEEPRGQFFVCIHLSRDTGRVRRDKWRVAGDRGGKGHKVVYGYDPHYCRIWKVT